MGSVSSISRPAHDSAFRAGLVRDQFHAQHLSGEVSGFVHRLGDLYATALAAAAGVNLRLDHDAGRARVE
jgi:hypothetical protein